MQFPQKSVRDIFFNELVFLFAWLFLVTRYLAHSQKWLFSPLIQGGMVNWVFVTLIDGYLKAASQLYRFLIKI